MKALKQKFHDQIIKKQKYHYFQTIRKQLLEFQEFQILYHNLLDNNEDLIILVEKFGYIVFHKYISLIMDQKLYNKLYQNDKYFLLNLRFIQNLLACKVFSGQEVGMLIQGLSQIIQKYQQRLTSLNIREILQIVEIILRQESNLQFYEEEIKKKQIVLKLYYLIVQRQMTEYFYKIVYLCKINHNQQFNHLANQQLLHCIQISILTNQKPSQLYLTYSYLTEVFQNVYTPEEELFQYASILDKAMRDMTIQKLIDPILYFIIKAIKNPTLAKLFFQMKFVQHILDVIFKSLQKQICLSTFGQQSIWLVLRKGMQYMKKNKENYMFYNQKLVALSKKLQQKRFELHQNFRKHILNFLKQMCQTNLKATFQHSLELYMPNFVYI